MRSQGLADAAKEQEQRLENMFKQREAIVKEMDSALAELEKQEKNSISMIAQ